jgi:hypothetical protein
MKIHKNIILSAKGFFNFFVTFVYQWMLVQASNSCNPKVKT